MSSLFTFVENEFDIMSFVVCVTLTRSYAYVPGPVISKSLADAL